MAQSKRAALVTGSNKGIGFGIVRELCKQFDGTVYLTARDAARGEDAVLLLKDEGLTAHFIQLDVTDIKSIEKAKQFLVENHGGLDVLVNNAGIFLGTVAERDKYSTEIVKKTMETNFFGLLNVCKILFPILRPHARVVNVTSSLGSLRHLQIDDTKRKLTSIDVTVQDIEKIANDYVALAEKSDPAERGYPKNFGAYTFSKILVSALTRAQQRIFDADGGNRDIVVNAVCPGFVATDLNQHQGYKTIEQGADSPVYLALLPPQLNDPVTPRGEIISERTVKNWAEDQ